MANGKLSWVTHIFCSTSIFILNCKYRLKATIPKSFICEGSKVQILRTWKAFQPEITEALRSPLPLESKIQNPKSKVHPPSPSGVSKNPPANVECHICLARRAPVQVHPQARRAPVQVHWPNLPSARQKIHLQMPVKNIVLMEASEVDAATRFQLDAASRFQLETTGCMNPSVNLGRDMRTNYLQFVHNAGLGREMRSNDYQNMFNAASMIHENPTTNNLQFIGIKVPPTLHIPPPTLAIPNFEVPTNGTHGYSYPYSGYGKRVKSNHASSYHITRPGSGGHATYGGSTIHLSFLDRASLDHMSYESGALTAYTSGAHQVGCSGEPSNYENGRKHGISMIGSRGKFYGDNSAHTIYTNGAHQADYS
ncbi:hypothetical protein AMTRI_Chr13g122330 [Amborella trichopoda]